MSTEERVRASRIVVLPPEVVDQIAAGEVVERPASVVKELVENALDAGARRIDVEVQGEGGRGLIRVADDGCGMTPEEARLSLERHATSKLRGVDDLARVRTMGFRGEALPSIASVSRLTLVTRAEGASAGCLLRVEGGRPPSAEPAGARPGTTLEVRDLFYNTPARLKFLKSAATESAHIHEAVLRLALAAPGCHFALSLDGRRAIDLPPGRDHHERARAALGRAGARLRPVEHGAGGLSVRASLGPPDEARRSPASVALYVNGRFVRDRGLTHAVCLGYGERLPKGRFPTAVVHIELDPSELDVNVHPQKIEVRFAQPGAVFSLVRACVEAAASRSVWLGGGDGPDGGATEATRVYRVERSAGGYEEQKQRILEATRRFWSASSFSRDAPPTTAAEALAAFVSEGSAPTAAWSPVADPDAPPRAGFFSGLRILGQALGTYIVCEAAEEVVLIDQHAAHERVAFEQLRARARLGPVPSQRLLVPEVLSLDPERLSMAADESGTLARLGYEVEPFGPSELALRAVPEAVPPREGAPLLLELLDALAEGGGTRGAASLLLDPLLARIACHRVVRAGRALGDEEMGALLSSLDEVDFAASCPHGRPVLVRFGRAELDRRLGR
jgi:DNA mismatch repair protein MutL